MDSSRYPCVLELYILAVVPALSKGITMARLSLYMDEESAACPGEDAAGWKNGWPPGFFDLYGSSPDFPEAEDLELAPIGCLGP